MVKKGLTLTQTQTDNISISLKKYHRTHDIGPQSTILPKVFMLSIGASREAYVFLFYLNIPIWYRNTH